MTSRNASGLPAASPATVLRIFQRLVCDGESPDDAPPEFHRADLQAAGIGQVSQAITLLGFLGLRGQSGELEVDVQAARKESLDALTDLVLDRFQRACDREGWWTDRLAGFGRQPLDRRLLTELLESLPPLKRQQKGSKTNILGGLRTLHALLVHRLDPQWIEDELCRRGKRRRPSSPAEDAPDSEPARQTASPRTKRRAASPSATSAAPRGALEDVKRFAQSRGYNVKSFDGLIATEFCVGRDERGERVVVNAHFDPPLDSLDRQQLLAIVCDLRDIAEKRMAEVSSGHAGP